MNPTEQAKAKGCIYERKGTQWVAVLRKRGRALSLASFVAPTQDEASQMWLDYKEGKRREQARG